MSLITLILILLVALFYVSDVEVSDDSSVARPVTAPTIKAAPLASPLSIGSEGANVDYVAVTRPGAYVSYAIAGDTLYRADAAMKWTETGTAPYPSSIVVADDPDVLMTGDTETCARGGGGATVEISTDGGASWTPSSDERAIRPLAIWADDGFAIGAWWGGVLLSDDLGATWQNPPADATLGFEVTAFAVVAGTDRGVLFALTGEGGTSTVYHVDLADPAAWTNLEPIFTYWALGGLAGVGGTFAIASITGVSISEDSGRTWTTDRSGLEDVTLDADPAVEGLPAGVDPTGKGFRSILLDEAGAPVAVGGEQSVYLRVDGSWVTGIANEDPTTVLTFSPDGTTIYAQGESVVMTVPVP